MMQMPCLFRSRIRSKSLLVSASFSEEVGSSKMRILQSIEMDLMISTICWSAIFSSRILCSGRILELNI